MSTETPISGLDVSQDAAAASEPASTDLAAAGFARVGAWRLSAAGDGIALDGEAERLAGVYAYVVDGKVHYIGSAQRGLHNRFRRYITSQTMRTSMRVRGEIIACLTRGDAVEIFALVPPKLSWRGLPVDLVAGLEEGLIRSMRPPWNRRSNRGSP